MQALGCVSEQVAVLVDRAALRRHVAPEGGQCLLQPRTAVDDQKLWLAQPALDEIVENGAPRRAGLAAHVLGGQQHFLAVLAHAEHDRSTIAVAFRSSRTRTTVPSRIRRMIGSSANERAFQASQSPFTFRHTWLTVSLLTAPPKTAERARRTRRVLVPAR